MLSIHNVPLSVAKNELRGLPWIFSNQVCHLEDSLLTKERTSLVRITDLNRIGIYNKSALISVRLLPELFAAKLMDKNEIEEAEFTRIVDEHFRAVRRNKISTFPFTRNQCFRWIHGDADGMPGIVVDDYVQFTTLQCSCAAAEFLLQHVIEALKLHDERPILERSSGQARAMEGLAERTRWIRGKVEQVSISFVGLELKFEPLRAQKTGLFLDQRRNLEFLTGFLSHKGIQPKSMLDICSYAGAWSSAGASAGIESFTLIDADAQALSMARSNIIQNSPNAQARGSDLEIELRHGDLFEELSKLKSENRLWDVVVADPPAFAKNKKHLLEASRAYARLAKLAARVSAPNGVLVLCSCSKNMDAQNFWDIAVRNLASEWILIHRGEQSPDHTVGTTQAASEYLKCLFFQKRSFAT